MVLVSVLLLLVLSPPRRTVLVLSETVLVLDGCLICGDADARRFAVICGPMDRIAMLDRFEHEHEHEHDGIRCEAGSSDEPLPGRIGHFVLFEASGA